MLKPNIHHNLEYIQKVWKSKDNFRVFSEVGNLQYGLLHVVVISIRVLSNGMNHSKVKYMIRFMLSKWLIRHVLLLHQNVHQYLIEFQIVSLVLLW